MQIEAYLRIVSDEHTIRAIHGDTRLIDASIGPLKARKEPGGEGVWWNWQTQRIQIDYENLDGELMTLLETHRPIFLRIREFPGAEIDVYLEIVSHYVEGEEPQGLYLSAETIHLLGEMGCALDNDVVVTLPSNARQGGGR